MNIVNNHVREFSREHLLNYMNNYFHLLDDVRKEQLVNKFIEKDKLKKEDKLKKKDKFNKKNKNLLILKNNKTIIANLVSYYSKGNSKLIKLFYKNFLSYYSEFLFLTNTMYKYDGVIDLLEADKKQVYLFFGCDIGVMFDMFFKNIHYKNGCIFNSNYLLNNAISELYISIRFLRVTNIQKLKRKVKTTTYQPINIFGKKEEREAIKNFANLLLKTDKISELGSMIPSELVAINGALSIRTRLNWGYSNLLFNHKKSIFFKKKWSIFLKHYKLTRKID